MEKNTFQVLIARHLKFYQALDDGSRAPNTALQVHFVSVCRGEWLPQTDHERAYMAYRQSKLEQAGNTPKPAKAKPVQQQTRKLTPRKPVKPDHRPAPGTKPAHPPSYVRFEDEPWGTRAAFNQDSGRNRNRSR
jgi:hypothetical protein